MNENLRPMFLTSLDPDAVRLIGLAKEKGIRLTAAESCTGGLLATLLTAVPGASEVLEGTLVAYSPRIKEKMLNIPAGLIRSAGIVSEAVASAMAKGAAALFSADLAAGITGWAGPDGGDGQPAGTVCIAVCAAGKIRSVCRRFGGSRDAVRLSAARYALEMLAGAASDGDLFPDRPKKCEKPEDKGE